MKHYAAAIALFLVGFLTSACSPATSPDLQKAPAEAQPAAGGGKTEPAETTARKTGQPALWKTGDADTTVYIFGTVHVLPPNTDWRTEALDQAMSEASVVYFETDLDPNPVEMTTLVARLGLYPRDERLTPKLKPDDLAALTKAADELKIPLSSLDRMRPWLAATTLAQRMIVEAGFDPMSGVERTLAPMAKNDGKTIRKFESIEDQLMIFAGLSEDIQMRYLIEGLHNAKEQAGILTDLVEAWRTGDVDSLDRIMIQDDMGDLPEVYDALLVKRNRNWATALDQIIETEPGVFFIAVGAAHLAGKDSVVNMLAQDGHAAQRVQ